MSLLLRSKTERRCIVDNTSMSIVVRRFEAMSKTDNVG